MNFEHGFTPRDFVLPIFRHRFKAVVAFFLILSLAAIYILLVKKQYQSEAKLYVGIGHENVALDATASLGPTLGLLRTYESEINSALEILKSRSLAAKVVEDLGPDAILKPQELMEDNSLPARAKAIANQFMAYIQAPLKRLSAGLSSLEGGDGDTTAEHRLAVRELLERVSLSSPKMSSVLVIRSKAPHPAAAQRISEAWTTAFLSERLRLTRTAGSYRFFEAQAEALKAELEEAENALKEAKIQYGVASIEGQERQIEDRISAITNRLTTNRAALAAARAKVAVLRGYADEIDPLVTTEQQSTNEMGRSRLYELLIEEQALRARFHPNHPQVIAIVEQRKELESILQAQPDATTQSQQAPNPTRQVLDQSLFGEVANVASLEAEQEVLVEQQATLREHLVQLNRQTLELKQMQRRVTSLDNTYQMHQERMEQARVHQSLQAESISSVNVIQPASYDDKPVSLPRKILALLSLGAAFIGSYCTAFCAEFMDRSIRRSGQVEDGLGLPVFVSIPRTKSPRMELPAGSPPATVTARN